MLTDTKIAWQQRKLFFSLSAIKDKKTAENQQES